LRLRSLITAMATILFLIELTAPCAVLAHGVGYRQSDLRPVSLEFSYSTGETMSYLETRVFSPLDEKFAFQSGRTDEAGRFAFTPDSPGQWRIVVKDEEGHQAEAVIDVTEDFLNKGGNFPASSIRDSSPPKGMDLFIRATLGVSLLFNIAAGFYCKTANRKVKVRL